MVVLAGYKTVKQALVQHADVFGHRDPGLLMQESHKGHGKQGRVQCACARLWAAHLPYLHPAVALLEPVPAGKGPEVGVPLDGSPAYQRAAHIWSESTKPTNTGLIIQPRLGGTTSVLLHGTFVPEPLICGWMEAAAVGATSTL